MSEIGIGFVIMERFTEFKTKISKGDAPRTVEINKKKEDGWNYEICVIRQGSHRILINQSDVHFLISALQATL